MPPSHSTSVLLKFDDLPKNVRALITQNLFQTERGDGQSPLSKLLEQMGETIRVFWALIVFSIRPASDR